MKQIIYLALLLLIACSGCDIPLGKYASSGGEESQLALLLAEHEFVLTHETWLPGQYEGRKQVEERGTWSCKGKALIVNNQAVALKAKLTPVGENPLGYASSTKALLFEPSKDNPLSNEILYPLNARQ